MNLSKKKIYLTKSCSRQTDYDKNDDQKCLFTILCNVGVIISKQQQKVSLLLKVNLTNIL